MVMRNDAALMCVVLAGLVSSCGVNTAREAVVAEKAKVCSTPTMQIQSDSPDYRSLDSFPPDETVAVVATVDRSVAISDEDSASSLRPYPLDAVTLQVDRVVRGQVSEIVVVARTGGGGCAFDEDVTPLVEGSQVLLFLAPTKATWRDLPVYLSWALDQSVYDIEGGIVTQRTPPNRMASLDPPLPLEEAIKRVPPANG